MTPASFIVAAATKLAPKLWDLLVEGKDLSKIPVSEILKELDLQKYERDIARAQAKKRLNLPP